MLRISQGKQTDANCPWLAVGNALAVAVQSLKQVKPFDLWDSEVS